MRTFLRNGVYNRRLCRRPSAQCNLSRTITSVHDMTFGEYVRHLESPVNWQKFSANLDRSVFISGLKKIGTIRNEVTHFDPDPIRSRRSRNTSLIFEVWATASRSWCNVRRSGKFYVRVLVAAKSQSEGLNLALSVRHLPYRSVDH
jgi:hypothetical protein